MRYRQVTMAISLTVACAVTFASSSVSAAGETVQLAGAQKLYEDCSVLAAASADLSDVKQHKMESVVFCLGYLQATRAALERIHRNYTTQFPNYGHWDDRDFVASWIVAQVISDAQDVCFPEHINTKILAMILSKYGKEHPEKLTIGMFDFASEAFKAAYPANKGCSH
jgi:hypothetical protein